MHILVVDDDQAVRDSLARSLKYTGYEVTTASDGVAALAQLSTTKADAVIMDVMMPRLDGLETTRMLRTSGNDPLGMVRSTSAYLREDGGAGTMQQIDLAV